jgi:hypothetical protein
MSHWWRRGAVRRGSRGKHCRRAMSVEPLETRVLMNSDFPTSVWTGDWNTNFGVLLVPPMEPPHESPYPQLDDIILDGGLGNANTGAPLSDPTYALEASLAADPSVAAVLTGTVLDQFAAQQLGTFTFNMTYNPNYPTTPDSFTGTLKLGSQVLRIQGTYAGSAENTQGNIIPGTEPTPPRPRPVFGSTTTPSQPSQPFPFRTLENLTLLLKRATENINERYHTISNELGDAREILANGDKQQAETEIPKLEEDNHALVSAYTNAFGMSARVQKKYANLITTYLADLDSPDVSAALVKFTTAANNLQSAMLAGEARNLQAVNTMNKLISLKPGP